MKKFAVLCTVFVILSVTFLPVYAMGMPGTGSAGNSSAMSGEMLPSGDGFYDAGNNARTGDTATNGGARDGSAGGTAQGTVGGTETTRNSAESGSYSDNSAGSVRSADEGTSMTTGESAAASGSGWFAVILSIIVVAAIIALIVALLPKRNRV